MDILSEMSSVYYELTISEKRIAEYILDHTDEVQMMSISELAEACHVGEATITRFCKRFHSRGYTALKIELVKLSHPSYEPFLDSQESETMTDSTVHQNVGGMLYGEYSAAMKQTAELLKKEQVIRAVEVLSQAEIVYCMGQGGSMLMAEEAAHLFSTVRGYFISSKAEWCNNYYADEILQISRGGKIGYCAAMRCERIPPATRLGCRKDRAVLCPGHSVS